MISAALASVLSQDERTTPKGVKQNNMKGTRDQNAGWAPEAEVGFPNEPSLEAEGDPAGRPLGSELTRKKCKELQRENLTTFLAKARNRTADEAVTADALRVAGYLARSDIKPIIPLVPSWFGVNTPIPSGTGRRPP